MTVPTLFAVRTQGERPLLVLGPSLGTSTAMWDPVIPFLRDHFDLLAWDLPGHGRSPAATESFTVGEVADAVAVLVEETGIDRFFHAGDSFGGGVSLELALRYPKRVDGIATICSGAKFHGAQFWGERAATIREHGMALVLEGASLRWFTPEFVAADTEIACRLSAQLAAMDGEAYARCCEALAGFDVRQRLAEIAVPVLAISGDRDPVISHASAEQVASGVQNGRAVAVSDAAHLAPTEKPHEVAELLVRLAKGASASS